MNSNEYTSGDSPKTADPLSQILLEMKALKSEMQGIARLETKFDEVKNQVQGELDNLKLELVNISESRKHDAAEMNMIKTSLKKVSTNIENSILG